MAGSGSRRRARAEAIEQQKGLATGARDLEFIDRMKRLSVLDLAPIVEGSDAAAFLLGFAKTARAHWIELALRFVAGAAFVVQAPHSRFSAALSLAGWALVITTAGLAVVPWHWHRAFAQRAVPYATRYPSLIGMVSFVLGALVLAAALTGGSA